MKKQQSIKSNWFTSVKLCKDIWAIAEFGHFEKVISYLIVGKNRALLFDTGMGIGDIKEIVSKITNLPILVINSHTHFDHIGGNHQFENVYIFNHPFSINNAKKGFTQEKMFKAHNKSKFIKKAPLTFLEKKYIIKPYSWMNKITEGKIVTLDPFEFKVIHTPGHSPDSICLYEANKGILFSGDTLYEGPIYLQLPESNFIQYQQSIKKLSMLSSLKKIFSAHNEYIFPVEKLSHISIALSSFHRKNSLKFKLIIDSKISLLI